MNLGKQITPKLWDDNNDSYTRRKDLVPWYLWDDDRAKISLARRQREYVFDYHILAILTIIHSELKNEIR